MSMIGHSPRHQEEEAAIVLHPRIASNSHWLCELEDRLIGGVWIGLRLLRMSRCRRVVS